MRDKPIPPAGPNHPVLALLTSHWVGMLGAALVTIAGCSWVLVLPLHLKGNSDNPYIGLLAFVGIPLVFFAGLALIPLGLALARRKIAAGLRGAGDRSTTMRRLAVFFLTMTLVNVLIGSQLTYRAVQHMETNRFCGQTCHVMQPEFTSHLEGPHQKVGCVDCHVTPGASGWVRAKLAGIRQLREVTFNSFPRPIPSGLESNRLAPSAETCEQCHSRERNSGSVLRILSSFKDDEANTPTKTVLMMKVGGGAGGGIHGTHMGPGVGIRYAAADARRQTIPWVEYRNNKTGASRTYISAGTQPRALESLARFEMQCVDCHNRPTHTLELPGRALDRALAAGTISRSLPYVKKTGTALLIASYAGGNEAARGISDGLASFYREKYPDVMKKNAADIGKASEQMAAAYGRNVFPDLKIAWGTYPNNLGHTDYPGCFRCHDEAHATADKKTITQDCGACHQALAVDETAPEILKTLGLD